MVSWCSHCQANAPILESIRRNYAPSGVFVLAVAETWTSGTGMTASMATTQNFIQQYGSQYKYVLDETGSAARVYGVDSTPSYFILDKSGKISAILIGEQTYGALSNAVEAALRG